MRRYVVGAVLAFFAYLALRLAVLFSGLALIVEPEYLVLIGITLAFCWSVLLFMAGKINFSLGVNVAWLSIALPALLFSYGSYPNNWVLGFQLFFLIFPLTFVVHYLFFNSELKNEMNLRLAALIAFGVIGVLTCQTELIIF